MTVKISTYTILPPYPIFVNTLLLQGSSKGRRMKQAQSLALITFHLLIMLFVSFNSLGQIPVINTPQPATMQPNVIIGNPSNTPGSVPNVPNYNTGRSIQQTNMDIINKDLNQSNNPYDPTSNDVDVLDQYSSRQQMMDYVKSSYRKA
jgi:hypothetical protein